MHASYSNDDTSPARTIDPLSGDVLYSFQMRKMLQLNALQRQYVLSPLSKLLDRTDERSGVIDWVLLTWSKETESSWQCWNGSRTRCAKRVVEDPQLNKKRWLSGAEWKGKEIAKEMCVDE